MNRAFFVILAGLSLAVAGCASDVVDPVAPPPVAEEQKLPPDQALNAPLRDHEALLLGGVEIDHGFDHIPQVLPEPGPWPEGR